MSIMTRRTATRHGWSACAGGAISGRTLACSRLRKLLGGRWWQTANKRQQGISTGCLKTCCGSGRWKESAHFELIVYAESCINKWSKLDHCLGSGRKLGIPT